MRALLLVAVLALMTACVALPLAVPSQTLAVPTVTPPPSLPPTLESPLSPTPGLIVRGRVHLQNGSGLAGVTICRNFASYPGTVVATTDADGTFQSDFAFIPGDEMVGVWPLGAGYNFQPDSYRWRHYFGPEDRTLDFVASPTTATSVPPVSCQ